MSRVERRCGWWLMLLAGLLALVLALALAQALPPSLQGRAEQLPPPLRAQLQQRAATWEAWTPTQQRAFRQRLQEWNALPRAQRGARRESYMAWQALDSIDREQVQAARARYSTLPAEQQQALRARFAELDTNLRRGWLLGPRLGADYAALQPLLQQVPAEQRLPLLAALRDMDHVGRANLAVLVQRTPPQERDALRRELLSTAAANRDAWLRSRLEQ